MYIIRKASEQDIRKIWEIQNLYQMKGDSSDMLFGFLVSGYTQSDFRSFLTEEGVHLLVCEYKSEVVGYLLGFEAWKERDTKKGETLEVLCKLDDFDCDRLFYIKQIGTLPDARGAGSALYRKLFEMFPNCDFAATIVLDPPNLASIRFHERLGFQRFVLYQPKRSSHLRGVWLKPKDGEVRVRHVLLGWSLETLVEYFAAAKDLYMHEDNLNWTKIGQHIAVLTALIMALFFISTQFQRGFFTIPYIFIAIFGSLLNKMFVEKIKSGLWYFNHHKRKLITLQECLLFWEAAPPLIDYMRRSDKDIVVSRTEEWLRRYHLFAWLAWGSTLLWALVVGMT